MWRMEKGPLPEEVKEKVYNLTRISFRLNGQGREDSGVDIIE